MWLIVGLGNPGSKYLLTRHNIGFITIDFMAKAVGARLEEAKDEHQALTLNFKWDSEPVMLAKPVTFMNLSGDSVGELMRYYKIEPEKLLVICDDLDQPFGQIRFKNKSGDGGHNGLKSLIEQLGSNEFMRLKVGIGRPPHPEMEPAAYVLQNFSKEEQAKLPALLDLCLDGIETFVFEGAMSAMNNFNGKSI